jgi:Intracellular proteinase inhibitor
MALGTRMMARLALAVGACLFAAGYSRCSFTSGTGSGSTGGGSIGGASYTTTLLLRDSTGTATNSFVMGEPIRFELEIRNNDNDAATLRFSDAQIYDFYVLDGDVGTTHWRWSDGMTFAQIPTQLSFFPNSSKAYSLVWNGVLGDGTQLPAGSYRARGAIVADSHPSDPLASSDLNSNIVNFTVR